MSRSMQFTALNTIAFADIPADRLAGANTLFSTAMQLTMGLGIALGALALRSGQILVGNGIDSYRIAFVLIAVVAVLGISDSVRLARGAGTTSRARPDGQSGTAGDRTSPGRMRAYHRPRRIWRLRAAADLQSCTGLNR